MPKAEDDKPFTDKPLYKLLTARFASVRTHQNIFDVRSFSTAIGMSPEGVYKWLRADRLSADGATKILEFARTLDAKLTREDLIVFVLR